MRAPKRRPQPRPKGAITDSDGFGHRLNDHAWWETNAPTVDEKAITDIPTPPQASSSEESEHMAAAYGVTCFYAQREARARYLVEQDLVVDQALRQAQFYIESREGDHKIRAEWESAVEYFGGRHYLGVDLGTHQIQA